MVALAIFLIALRFWGLDIFIYILAIIWWLPINIAAAFLFLGPFAFNLTIPEVVVYSGLLFLPFSKYSKNRQGKQNVLLDPIWIFLTLLLLGGLIASTNIKTLAGYAMFRRSTFFFISIIIVCRYLLTSPQKILRVLNLLLISNVLFIAFILIAPTYKGILFETALSYQNTIRLGGNYIIPGIGSFYFGPNNIGLITGIGAILALTFACFMPNLKKRLLAGAVFMLNVIVLGLTGSRGSWISTSISIITVILCFMGTQKKNKAILYVAALLITSGIVLLRNILPKEILNRIQSLASINSDVSVQTRLYLIKKGINLFWRNPFGIGYGTFVTLTDNFVLWEQNLFLNTTMGGGFLGLIGLLGFFFILFWRGVSKFISERKETRYIYLAPLAASLAFFINSFGTDPNSEISVYIAWLVLGITFASISLPKLAEPSPESYLVK